MDSFRKFDWLHYVRDNPGNYRNLTSPSARPDLRESDIAITVKPTDTTPLPEPTWEETKAICERIVGYTINWSEEELP